MLKHLSPRTSDRDSLMSSVHTADVPVICDSPAFSAESQDCPRQRSHSPLPGSRQRVPAVWVPRRYLQSVTDVWHEKQIDLKQKTIVFHLPCPEWCHRAWQWAMRRSLSESSCTVLPVGVSRGLCVLTFQSHPRLSHSTPFLHNQRESREFTLNS